MTPEPIERVDWETACKQYLVLCTASRQLSSDRANCASLEKLGMSGRLSPTSPRPQNITKFISTPAKQ